MTAADSNVILRLLLGDVPEQTSKALAWLNKQPNNSVIVTDAVLVEILFLLESKRAYRLSRATFYPLLMKVLRSKPWKLAPLTRNALEIFRESRLDYTDCLLIAMHQGGVVSEVATFDKDMHKKLPNILA